jgi:hypothetical protein
VKKLTDQVVLAEIAKGDVIPNVRCDAVMKLADQVLVEDIAKTDSDWAVRIAAADHLEDKELAQDFYFQISEGAENERVQMAAAEKLVDQTVAQSVFTSLAKNCEDSDVRKAAVKKLIDPDQEFIAAIAKAGGVHMELRMAALDKLTDQELLAKVVRDICLEGGWASSLPGYALKKLSDPKIVYAIEEERDAVENLRGDHGEFRP